MTLTDRIQSRLCQDVHPNGDRCQLELHDPEQTLHKNGAHQWGARTGIASWLREQRFSRDMTGRAA